MAISSANTGLRAGVCTSTTRPSNPYLGQLIFETDTFVLNFWNGSSWQGAVSAPAGTVQPFAGTTAPTGWLLCGGQAISRVTYANLFTIIGTTYGVGDGSTTFNIPDLRGRTVAGLDNIGGSAANRITSGNSGIAGTTLGAAGGDERLHQHSHSNSLSNATVAPSNHQHAETIMHSTTSGSNGITPYAPWNDPVFGVWSTPFTYANRQGFTMASPEGAGATGYPHLTSGPLSSTTVSINNANSGNGLSQNVQPTILLNYMIKF